jgi:hypothetical protein
MAEEWADRAAEQVAARTRAKQDQPPVAVEATAQPGADVTRPSPQS